MLYNNVVTLSLLFKHSFKHLLLCAGGKNDYNLTAKRYSMLGIISQDTEPELNRPQQQPHER